MADQRSTVSASNGAFIEALEDYIPHVLKYCGTPGLNLAVARRGDLIWEAAYGYADIEQGVRMTPTTVFRSGSMGKTYTATAVMQLIERGFMELDDPINQHLSKFTIENPLGERSITFRDLLTHRSGLAMDTGGSQLHAPAPLSTYIPHVFAQTYFPSYGGALRHLWGSRVGEKYVYSNLGIALLGYLVEVINPEALSFSAYVQTHIIDPLEMTSTQFPEVQDAAHIQPDIYRRLSKGYMRFGAVHLPSPTIYLAEYPAGAVVSIPREHIRILLAYMNRGRYKTFQLLKPQSVESMLRPESETGEGYAVGLVWNLFNAGRPNYAFGHAGAHMWGWTTKFLAFPAQELAIVLATNHWNMTDDKCRYAAPDLIAEFACSWLDRWIGNQRQTCAGRPWAWRVSYVMGMTLVERTNGALGVSTRIPPESLNEIARGVSIQSGASYDESLWDPDGFQSGVRDMQEVEMTPQAIRAFMLSHKMQVSSDDLRLIYLQLGTSSELIPWSWFGPEVANRDT